MTFYFFKDVLDDLDGTEYQVEMMKMLRDVNVKLNYDDLF
jgi:hypothetical protein